MLPTDHLVSKREPLHRGPLPSAALKVEAFRQAHTSSSARPRHRKGCPPLGGLAKRNGNLNGRIDSCDGSFLLSRPCASIACVYNKVPRN